MMPDRNGNRPASGGGRTGILFCTLLCVALGLCGLTVLPPEDLQAGGMSLHDGADTGTHRTPAALCATGIRLAQSSARGGETWTRREERVVSGGNEPTRVRIRGNAVLVPVTVAYGGREADLHLLLDTGASMTTIHAGVAERLSVDLGRAKKIRVQVVGGDVLEARSVALDRLTVGPHTRRDVTVVVLPHKGPAARHDGLLGMDVLRGLEYRVDFRKQVIVWE